MRPLGGASPRPTPASTPAKLQAAVDFALASDSPWPRSFYHPDGRYVGNVEWNETGPWSEIVGPVVPRGGPAGVILKGGRIVAEWGDTARPDMTFSVAKSYLAVLAGLAVSDGLIASVDEPVGATVKGPWFASAHNARVTWRHLLHQSSEWQGELWGKSDQVDHNRQTGVGADQSRKGQRRELKAPGTHFEYNDVRVNLLAFCLLQRFGRPLPDVLRERVMDPIGASKSWEWHGYRHVVDGGGRPARAVGGGRRPLGRRHAHRRARSRAPRPADGARRPLGRPADPARGVGARRVHAVADQRQLRLPVVAQPGSRPPASAPASSVFAVGAGNNMIWIDPDHDLVTVLRWIDGAAVGGFLAQADGGGQLGRFPLPILLQNGEREKIQPLTSGAFLSRERRISSRLRSGTSNSTRSMPASR